MLWKDNNKVVALAFNYIDLNENEKPGYEYPAMFMKSPTSITSNGEKIYVPKPLHGKVWPEVELGFLFDKYFQLYFFVANDVSAFNVNAMDVHLAFSKAIDTFCPISTPKKIDDIDSLMNRQMITKVNGEVVQEGNTKDMWFKPLQALKFIQEYITLIPGDIILTGTCKHNKTILQDGDIVEVGIEGLDTLHNRVVYK